MPRRGKVIRRQPEPDARYHSERLARFINRVMWGGKRSTAERIMYAAMSIVEKKTKRNPLEVFEEALKNASPLLEVRPRRIGGATYQVPNEVRPERGLALGMRWLVTSARSRKGRPMAEKMAAEIIDASRDEGTAVKKRTDTHRMAEANRAFAHYRW